MKKEAYYKINPDQATLHVSQGNSKIGKGIWSFSTLPGNEEHMIETTTHGLLTDIPGTCGKLAGVCAGSCYAFNFCRRFHNSVIPALAENTILLRNGKLWDQLAIFLTLKNGKAEKFLDEAHKAGMDPDEALAKAKELAAVKVFRIHTSGEVENAQQFRRWAFLALAHPMTQFTLYTKNFDALGEWLDDLEANHQDIPANFSIQISQWHHCADEFIAKYAERWSLGIFEYDDSFVPGNGLSQEDLDRLAKMPHCPSIDKHGHHRKMPDGSDFTCDKCKGKMSCYNRNYRYVAVYAH